MTHDRAELVAALAEERADSDPTFNAPDRTPHRPYYAPETRVGDRVLWREWVSNAHVTRCGVVEHVETAPFAYALVDGRVVPLRSIERIERG